MNRIMNKRLVIETDAPADYMVDILRRVRNNICHGKYGGKGRLNRTDMVSYNFEYSYQEKVLP